jgi:hypothetical protein
MLPANIRFECAPFGRPTSQTAKPFARGSSAALALMRQLLLILSAVLAVGCSKPMSVTALPSEHADLSLAAFDYVLAYLESEGSRLGDFAAVLCLPGGREPDAAFLGRVGARMFPVLPCSSSARDNELHEFYLAAMNKSQTEFRIISIEVVAEGQARVRVGFRDSRSSSGMLLLELLNRAKGWTVTSVPQWAQT